MQRPASPRHEDLIYPLVIDHPLGDGTKKSSKKQVFRPSDIAAAYLDDSPMRITAYLNPHQFA